MQRRQTTLSRLLLLALLSWGLLAAAGWTACDEDEGRSIDQTELPPQCSVDSDCVIAGGRCCGSAGTCVEGVCEFFQTPSECCTHPEGCDEYCGIGPVACTLASDCPDFVAGLCCGTREDCVNGICESVQDDYDCCADGNCSTTCTALERVFCLGNASCLSPTPFCNLSTHFCVECLDDVHCTAELVCYKNACVTATMRPESSHISGFSTLSFQDAQGGVYSRHALGEVCIGASQSTDGKAHHFPGVLF